MSLTGFSNYFFRGFALALPVETSSPALSLSLSLYLYEIRAGSYPLLLVLERSCCICVCPVAWVEELDVMGTQVTSFLGLCCQLPPW